MQLTGIHMINRPSLAENRESLPSKDYLDSGESIVIVDDSKEILLIFTNILTNEGFTVFSATSASELYNLLEQENIALVLLDIGLPDQDGTVLRSLPGPHVWIGDQDLL